MSCTILENSIGRIHRSWFGYILGMCPSIDFGATTKYLTFPAVAHLSCSWASWGTVLIHLLSEDGSWHLCSAAVARVHILVQNSFYIFIQHLHVMSMFVHLCSTLHASHILPCLLHLAFQSGRGKHLMLIHHDILYSVLSSLAIYLVCLVIMCSALMSIRRTPFEGFRCFLCLPYRTKPYLTMWHTDGLGSWKWFESCVFECWLEKTPCHIVNILLLGRTCLEETFLFVCPPVPIYVHLFL